MQLFLSPMGIEVTDEMITELQKYLDIFAGYLRVGNTAGAWILGIGALTAAVAILSQQENVKLFFHKKRIQK